MDNGLCVIKEYPTLRTNIRIHVADLDVAASYPNGGAVMNISKGTTRREICGIEGIDEYTYRMQAIGLSGGDTNSVEFCVKMLGMPEMDTMLTAFEQHIQQTS